MVSALLLCLGAPGDLDVSRDLPRGSTPILLHLPRCPEVRRAKRTCVDPAPTASTQKSSRRIRRSHLVRPGTVSIGSSSLGPAPSLPSASCGLRSGQLSSDRHPQPMHPVSRSRRFVSLTMRSSSCARHRCDSLLQSFAVAARPRGNELMASLIDASGMPRR